MDDFDERVSDIDLLAVTTVPIAEDELTRLDAVHHSLVEGHSAWMDRLEVVYVSAEALTTFRTARFPIAVISPGEEFNVKDAGVDWLITWFVLRRDGVALTGPPPSTLIPEITMTELMDWLHAHMEGWRERVRSWDAPGAQAYAILTACRGLYTREHQDPASKLKSAEWAKDRMPKWSDLVDRAIHVRAQGYVGFIDHAQTVRFVNEVVDRINPPRTY